MKDFIKNLNGDSHSITDHAVAILWFMNKELDKDSATPKELATILEDSGLAKQNVSRLTKKLQNDPRTIKADKGCLRINIRHMKKLDEAFSKYLNHKMKHVYNEVDSVLPLDMFSDARNYIKKVVSQINRSYDAELYDCCTVMCRRLLETLVIESYECKGKAKILKGSDNNYMMFSGLLNLIESNNMLGLSRNCIQGLKDFKKLGDLSAHNRKFNARKTDIDKCSVGIRVASEELLHECEML